MTNTIFPKGGHLPCPPEAFLNIIDAKRYEYLAAVFAGMDHPHLAQLCACWAEEHRLTATKLGEVEQRIAALDARMKGGAA
jgi:hypothetical protein